jgi:hypothetical protein
MRGGKRVSYYTLGGGVYNSRGETICSNNRTVSALRLNDLVPKSLRKVLSAPDVAERIHAGIKALYSRPRASKTKDLDSTIALTEGRIRNLTHALGEMGVSVAVTEALKEQEKRLADLQGERRAMAAREGSAPTVVPCRLR